MRKLVLHKCCEICWREDRLESESDGLSMEINGKDLDLCLKHAEQISVKLLPALVEDYGIKVGTTRPAIKQPAAPSPSPEAVVKKPERKHPCGIEGCSYKAQNQAGLGAHKRAKHGIIGSSKTALAERAAARR